MGADTVVTACRAFLRSYEARVGTFPIPEIERQAAYCAVGARRELIFSKWPSSKIFRRLLAADFAELQKMLAGA
jgi:hypothetical protein